MVPLKSPGPYGFNASFFQSYKHIVGEEVSSVALKFLNNGIFDKKINHTFIVLISKTNCPSTPSEYRPISFCNIIYNIISKTIANRLKPILSSIIFKFKSSFIPSRLISVNIIVAYEALHTMKIRQKGRQGYMAIKIDISKTYDRVEWIFLKNIMRKMGFAER